MKSVHSKDPRKPLIVAEMKRRLNCRKITTVEENAVAFFGIGMNFNDPVEYNRCSIVIRKAELNLLQTFPEDFRNEQK